MSSTVDLGAAGRAVGLGPAEAKGFYTRKRVKGRWVTGHFARKGGAKRVAAAEPLRKGRKAARSAYMDESDDVAEIEPKADAARSARAQTLVAQATSFETAPTQAAPNQAASAQRAAPVPQVAFAPSASAPALGEEERLRNLRDALQARANALTTTSSPPQPPRSSPEPQTVSLDFQSGVKTTVFSDGTSIQEQFDVAALKAIASPPRTKPGLP
jgi:hypothetical protein